VKNLLFPTLIVDDFLPDPDQLADYAKTLEYKTDPEYKWPGKRSLPLHHFNQELFEYIGVKILNCYNLVDKFTWNAMACFQLVESKYAEGWVHTDIGLLTSIIYLNKNPHPNSGTSLYKPKFISNCATNVDDKIESFKKFSQDPNYKLTDYDMEKLRENNQQFVKTLEVKNVYNRLFSFEAGTPHSADDFNFDEPRLTLVYFFREVNIEKNLYPLIARLNY
jgi:hypothetical protein